MTIMEDNPTLIQMLGFFPEQYISPKTYGEYLLQSGIWKRNRLRRKMNKRK